MFRSVLECVLYLFICYPVSSVFGVYVLYMEVNKWVSARKNRRELGRPAVNWVSMVWSSPACTSHIHSALESILNAIIKTRFPQLNYGRFAVASFSAAFFASRFPPASSSRCPTRAARRCSVPAVSWPESFCQRQTLECGRIRRTRRDLGFASPSPSNTSRIAGAHPLLVFS